MRKIPHDIERLMWLVAEEQDPKAIADFEERFPHLKYELAKHISMVRGLKSGAKRRPAREIPRFVPRHSSAPQARHRGLYVALAFVLGAVAFGSYAGYTVLSGPKTQPSPQAVVAVPQEPPSREPEPTTARTVEPERTPVVPDEPAPEPTPGTSDFEDPLKRLVSLKLSGTNLRSAIQSVCKSAGLQCELPLDMPNEPVTIAFDSISAGVILEQLGQEYGFTVFPQELGKVLILPGRPDGQPGPGVEPTTTPSGGNIAREGATPER